MNKRAVVEGSGQIVEFGIPSSYVQVASLKENYSNLIGKMTYRYNTFAKLLNSILLITLTGCAASHPVIDNDPFLPLAQKMLSVGIQQISERYIDPVRVSDLAIEGLRGLESIDESFEVEVTPAKIVIRSDQMTDQVFPRPLTENAEEWAKIMVTTLQFSRKHSSLVRTAREEKLFEAIFDGSVSLLDTFSRYSGASQALENRAQRSGFGGIGVMLKAVQNGGLVLTVIESSPANIAGVEANDLITHVDGIHIKGLHTKALLGSVRGKIGSVIKVTVWREKIGELTFSLKRKKILLPTVKLTEENGILHISVSKFNNETANEIATKVQKAMQLSKKTMVGLIMDLRGNPGGVLGQAIKVADLFLKSGKILTTHGRHPSSQNEYVAGENDILDDLPMVVLINGESASASEIVAAALQDHERAIIVGTSSFGKGSVQSVNPLPNDGELILTWSRFVTPSGYVLHNLGVPPNICSIGMKTDTENLVFEALRSASEFAPTLEAWRKASVEHKHERETLKRGCPPSPQKTIVDGKIAEKLILDNALYNQIIGLSSSIASAQQ